MNYLDGSAIKKLLSVPTPDLSEPNAIDYDEPGLQDATVDDALTVGGVAGLAKAAAPEVAETAGKYLGNEAGSLFPDGATFAQGKVQPEVNNILKNTPSWFTTEGKVADEYAGSAEGDARNVGFAKLSPKKVLDLSDLSPDQDTAWQQLHEKGVLQTAKLPRGMRLGPDAEPYEMLEKWNAYQKARDGGYDLVQIPDVSPSGASHVGYGALDPSIIQAATPVKMARGGKVPMEKQKDGPIIEDSTLEGFAKLLKQHTSTDTPKGYDDGGAVTPEDDNGPTFADKLKAVMSSMLNSPGMKIASTVANPMGALAGGGLNAILGATAKAETPVVNHAVIPAVNAISGTSIPQIPTPAQTAPAAALPAPAPAAPPVAAQTPPPAAPTPAAPPANPPGKPDSSPTPGTPGPAELMLQSMTGGDSDKLQAVLGQLKDAQKRGEFAKALAVIGDTFGNAGAARAGKTPEGFTSTKLVSDMNDKTQSHLVENVKSQLLNDPNSQTSRTTQMAAAQMLGIKPGDPRFAAIAKTPAAVLTQQLPMLNDAAKTSLEREAQTVQQGQFGQTQKLEHEKLAESAKDRAAQLQVANINANTAREKEQNDVANSAVEHLSPLNPMNWNTIGKAKSAINQAVSGSAATPAHPQDAAAVHWAHTHPNDPRAVKILHANGL